MATLSGLNMTSFAKWLKNYYYSHNMLNALMYGPCPFFRTIQKLPATHRGVGDETVFPIRISRSSNQSKDFGTAQSLAKSSSGDREKFTVKYDSDFAVARISNKVIYASQGNLGAFIQAFKDEMNGELEAMSQRRCIALQGVGDSVLGKVKSLAAVTGDNTSKTVTLTNTNNDIHFEKGDNISFAASTNSGSLRQVGGTSTVTYGVVTKVGASGVLTVKAGSGDFNAAVKANDYIFRRGDFKETNLQGLEAWIPASAPGATDSFNGLNRSVHPTRLAGHIVDGTSSPDYEELVRKAATAIIRVTKGRPSAVWTNPLVYDKIVTQLASNKRYIVTDGANKGMQGLTLQTGATGVTFNTSAGVLPLKISPWINSNRMWVLKEDSWAIIYLAKNGKKFIDFVDAEGGGVVKTSHDDAGIEVRAESYGAFGCFAPGCNAVIKL